MRILMVVGQFYPVIGGAELQCLKLSRALQKRGHTIQIVTVWNLRTTPRFEKIEGIPVERVWYPILNVFGYRIGLGFLAPFFMWWRVYRIVRDVDVVSVHQCLWPAFAATAAARLWHIPIVCKIGNSGERFDLCVLCKTHVYGRIAVWYVKRAISKFVWTSKAVRDDLVREGVAEDKLVNIPNGVELPNMPMQGLRSPGDLASEVRFIFTGTFTFKKNLLSLIEAIRTMPENYCARMKLILLGDGPDRNALTEAVKQYNLGSVVEICGPVDKVDPYLKKSDVFVLPSTTEGLSNSALEAMAYGLPLILSDRGGNSDLVTFTLPSPIGRGVVVRGDTGILIDPDNTQSLCDAMQYMIDHPEERHKMGTRSRQIVEERYSMERIVQQYENLYRSCISSHLP